MVEVKVDERGIGDVFVDGIPMRCVSGVNIEIKAGSPAKITVYADASIISVAAPDCEVVAG